jgi:hypothetical protein
MQKILVPLLALAALGFMAYKVMYKTSETTVTDPNAAGAAGSNYEQSAPKQQLDNVRTKARAIEANDQAYSDKIADETKSP